MRLALALLTALVLTLPSPASAERKQHSPTLATRFEVTIWEGPSSALVAAGTLTLNIYPETGNFTGKLTPGPSTTGTQFPVLFRVHSSDLAVEPVTGVT